MSILPNLRAQFNKDLSIDELKDVAAEIKSIIGVASVSFRKAAKDGANEVSVTYTQPSVPEAIKKIEGFVKFIPGNRF